MIDAVAVHAGKVLIVDDMPANVMLLEQMLRGAGYVAVSSTLDSTEVCALHLLHRYDLIILDLQMPGMDGFQVMENLKEIEAGGYLPVLVITAQPDQKIRALKEGARDFISKPFDLTEVLIRVYNLLEVRLLHQEARALYQRVLTEQAASKRVLLDLPGDIAGQIRRTATSTNHEDVEVVHESFAEMTVLFADIVAFTSFSEGASAEVLLKVLEDVSTRLEKDPGERAQANARTRDDAYLAVVGLPDAVAEKTIEATERILELTQALDRFNAQSPYQLRLRIGVETTGQVGGVSVGRTVSLEV